MKINEIISYLERLAPIGSQESYDNSGLLVGNKNDEVENVLLSLDCIEATVEEAIRKNCQLIIAHHPIVFKGLRKLNGTDYVQRTVLKAIKNDIAIYAIHTNLDNYRWGVNHEIGRRLKLENLKVLSSKRGVLNKLVVFVPIDHAERVRKAMFSAGAGHIGDYREASFNVEGIGTFMPVEGAHPFEGKIDQRSEVAEVKIEVMVSSHLLDRVVGAMKVTHPYEEVAFDIYALENENPYEGSGMVGDLITEMSEEDFLSEVKRTFNCGVIRHTRFLKKPIKRVAFCGGAGSFLLSNAKRSGADIFITGDYKYHEFFDAEDQIIIADIGHFESEQYTSELLADILKKNFSTFAVHLTEVNTNPINYF